MRLSDLGVESKEVEALQNNYNLPKFKAISKVTKILELKAIRLLVLTAAPTKSKITILDCKFSLQLLGTEFKFTQM